MKRFLICSCCASLVLAMLVSCKDASEGRGEDNTVILQNEGKITTEFFMAEETTSASTHMEITGIGTLEFSSNGDGTCTISNFYSHDDHSEMIHLILPDHSPTGETVIGIDSYAISDCNDLSSIEFPLSIQFIDQYAVNNCPNLNSIYISQDITYIHSGAFKKCSILEVFYGGTHNEWETVTDINWNFCSMSNSLEVAVHCSDKTHTYKG